MSDTRNEWVQDEDGTVWRWPFCAIPGCPNRICLAKGETRHCYPHSGSGLSLGDIIRQESDPASPAQIDELIGR